MRRLECISTDTQNVMADPLDFRVSDLELRVIRNASESGFLIPYYLKYNDSYAFVYNFEGYANLVDSLKSIDMDKWRTCMLSLFDCIEIIENNGFLNSCNLCLESDYVYFNPADQKVKLIYLPVENNFFFTDINEFTNTLRLFIRTTGENTGLLDSNTKAVLADSNSDIMRLKKAVEDFRPFQNNIPAEPAKKNGILSSLGFKKSADTKKKPVKSSSPVIHVQGGATEILDEGIAGIALVYKGNDYPLRIEIKNGNCIIGKQKESVDQVIPFSKAVSRVHCKVMFDNGEAGITDLGSSNGTFVNGKRLEKDEIVSIKAGDKIKIANLDFEVEDIKL
ncbi:MAG: FHA domain-containing protein [Aeriscardovia sp.]|nr:FHA domain-containing protein [Aeriscardovia sp.]MBR3461578.1 FHA domain-containing protein [Clostridiales bacterium]